MNLDPAIFPAPLAMEMPPCFADFEGARELSGVPEREALLTEAVETLFHEGLVLDLESVIEISAHEEVREAFQSDPSEFGESLLYAWTQGDAIFWEEPSPATAQRGFCPNARQDKGPAPVAPQWLGASNLLAFRVSYLRLFGSSAYDADGGEDEAGRRAATAVFPRTRVFLRPGWAAGFFVPILKSVFGLASNFKPSFS